MMNVEEMIISSGAKTRPEPSGMPSCTCAHIKIGSEVTEHRNWNPDCEEHGVDSIWWNSPEQKEKRTQQNERLRDLQQRAREARKKLE